jgi:hypothetical protein
VKVLGVITVKQLMFVDPNIAFSVDLSKGIEVELEEQEENVSNE